MDYSKLNKAELLAALAERDQSIAQLQAEDSNKAVADLQAALAERDARIAELEEGSQGGDAAEYEQKIIDLTTRINDLEKTKGNAIPLVRSCGKTYQLKGSITIGGVRKSTEEIIADQDLIDGEVKKGNAMFQLLN